MEFLILFFILIYTQLKIILNQNTQTSYRLEPMLRTKSILLEDNMIYIFNNESDFSINFIKILLNNLLCTILLILKYQRQVIVDKSNIIKI